VNQKGTGFLVKLTIFIALIISSLPGMTYFYMTVDGVEDSVQTQGQMQFLMADCTPLGSIEIYYYLDLDSSGTVEAGEPLYFEMNFRDNETEFPPDMDTTAGVMNVVWPLHMPPGNYVVIGIEGTDTLSFPYHVLAPEPLLNSISGRITFEGITPPEPEIAYYPFVIGTMDPPILMYTMTDELGDFYLNWPGDTATVFALFMMDFPGFETPDMPMFFVDGHSTGFDITFPIATGLTYLYMTVDGVESNTQVQGQSQILMADCDSLGLIDIRFYADLDSNESIDMGEPLVFSGYLTDNSTEFPPDLNPTPGVMEMLLPIHMPPGYYVVQGSDGSGGRQFPYHVLAPEPLTMSISGRLIFEDITPPDGWLNGITFFVGTMDPPLMMVAITDNFGDYSVNWPGDADTVSAMFMDGFPDYDDPDVTPLYVDGHATGFDIEFLLSGGGGLSDLRMWEDGIESTEHTQGVNYSFTMVCEEYGHVNIEFFVDEDGDGSIGPDDWNFFDMTWYVEDNNWVDDWYNDGNDTPGWLYISSPFHFPPGSYILRASDDYSSEQIAFTVLAPDPITRSISGHVNMELVTPPDGMLDEIVVYASDWGRANIYYGYVDSMGYYTCNWASGDMDVMVGIEPPYPSYDWDFGGSGTSVYIDGIITDVNLFVPYAAYDDSILIIFEQDSGLWDIPQSDIVAEYIDPVTHAVITTRGFPSEGEIYIPVRPDPCGIVFTGFDHHLFEHNFLSPYDTLWITPDSFPSEYHLFGSQCCYHFKLKLEGFELDSVPVEGITYDLYGTGPAGQSYYSESKMFIQTSGDEYFVMGGREMCPAVWTAVLRTPLPGGFIPEVDETSFVIPRVDTWPHMLIAIPVSFDNISETELPEGLSLNLYPNPFNGSVSIDFRVTKPGDVSIEVFDMMGRYVTNLSGVASHNGGYRARWDCTDRHGQPVSTGIYLFKLTTPTEMKILKGMYLK